MTSNPGYQSYSGSRLPPEIILIVFEYVDDFATLLNIRLTSRFYKDHTRNAQGSKLFHTLRLDKSRHHSAIKFHSIKKLNLLQWVQKVEVCTSCYLGLPSKEDAELMEADVYGGKQPEPHSYNRSHIEFIDILAAEYYSHMPGEARELRRFMYFLTYVLRTLAEPKHSPTKGETITPRRLQLDLLRDQSGQEVNDHMALRYPESPAWTNRSTIEPPYSAGIITEIVGFAFSHVLNRIFNTETEVFNSILNLYEIRYRGFECVTMQKKWKSSRVFLSCDGLLDTWD